MLCLGKRVAAPVFAAGLIWPLFTLAAIAAPAPGCVNIQTVGGAGDNATDNAGPLGAALTASMRHGKTCVYFPAGKYYFSKPVSYAMHDEGPGTQPESLTIVGDGADTSELTWPNFGNGLSISLTSQYNSVHIRHLSLTTGVVGGGGSGLQLAQTQASVTNPANTALSDITDVALHGADGYSQSQYWSTAITVNGVSNVNFVGDNIVGHGNAAYVNDGNGVVLSGTAKAIPVVFNFIGTTINYYGNGVVYGDYVQGVTISQANFTGGSVGVFAPVSARGLDQLNISNSQFNVQNNAVLIGPLIANVVIANNVFLIPGVANGVLIKNAHTYVISGNSFNGLNGNPTDIVIGTTVHYHGQISDNIFYNDSARPAGTGVLLQASASQVMVKNNSYTGLAANVIDQSRTPSQNTIDEPQLKTNVMAYQSAPQTLTPGAYNALQFQTAQFDDQAELNPATGVFTAKYGGYYVFTVGVSFDAKASTRSGLQIVTNNANAAAFQIGDVTAQPGPFAQNGSTPPVYLAAGQTAHAQLYVSNAEATNPGGAATYFGVTRVK